jgi:hypothetical protein
VPAQAALLVLAVDFTAAVDAAIASGRAVSLRSLLTRVVARLRDVTALGARTPHSSPLAATVELAVAACLAQRDTVHRMCEGSLESAGIVWRTWCRAYWEEDEARQISTLCLVSDFACMHSSSCGMAR